MINSIISSVMSLFGITQAPVTVSEFMWDVIIIIIGLWIIKYIMIFFTSLLVEMLKIH